MTTEGKTTTQAVDAVQAAAAAAKQQYEQYLNSDVVFVEPSVVAGPANS
jgi:hypothetical protein